MSDPFSHPSETAQKTQLTKVAPGILNPLPAAGITRVALMADVHLRTSVSGSTMLGYDFFKAALHVINDAHARGARAIFIAGDLIDTTNITAGIYRQLQLLHAQCVEYGIPAYVIMGNHDYTDPPWTDTLEGSDSGLISADNKTIRLPGLNVACIPFMRRDDLRMALNDLEPDVNAVMWHGCVKEWAGFDAGENAVTADDFPLHRLSAVMLGDIHITDMRWYARPDGTRGIIGYPGATETAKSDDPVLHFYTLMDFDQKTGLMNGFEMPSTNHRKVITLALQQESQLAPALAEIEKARDERDGRILVLANVADTITDASVAIKRAAGPAAVVRVTTYDASVKVSMTRKGSSDGDVIVPVEQRMHSKLPNNSELAALAVQLCVPGAPVSSLLIAHTGRIIDNSVSSQ